MRPRFLDVKWVKLMSPKGLPPESDFNDQILMPNVRLNFTRCGIKALDTQMTKGVPRFTFETGKRLQKS